MKKVFIAISLFFVLFIAYAFSPHRSLSWVTHKGDKLVYRSACMIPMYFFSTEWIKAQFEDRISILYMSPEEYACAIETLRNRGEADDAFVYTLATFYLTSRVHHHKREDLLAYFLQDNALHELEKQP